MPDTNLPGLVTTPNTTVPNTPSSFTPVKPAAPNPDQNSKQSGPVTSDPAGMNSDSFTGLLGSIGQKIKYNNTLADSRALLIKHLYDSPLSKDEVSKLPSDMQDIVNTGNKDAIELQVRVLNDQLQGRANTLGQTVQALSTGYQQSVTNTKNAMTEILAYAQSTGRPIADVVKALAPVYGLNVTSQMMDTLTKLGAPLLRSNQVPGNDQVYGDATRTVSSSLGVSPSISLSEVLNQSGMDPIVNAIIKNEGSSPKGVLNNPGNIKYTGLPGQLDSGIKASDGGTFASYATPEDGRHAIEFIIQNAADSKSSAYGANPTLGSFIDMYTNTAPDISVSPLPPEPSTGNVPSVGGFTPNAIYQDAIQSIFEKTAIQSFVGGLSNTGDAKLVKTAISNKAAAIATAMGGTYPQFQALYKANASAAKQNVERVARVESIANSMTLNVPRLQELANRLSASGVNITESDIQAGQAAAMRKFGSQDAAAYIELIQTIRSDYAATQAALAGSRGGQFFAQTANDAIPIGLSSDQYGTIKDTIVLSSQKAKQAINEEVQSLIGVNGGIGGNTPQGYDDYLNSIGQ